ncbi:DNA-directed RNA polymerase sigma-70 factor [Parapedobacter defluvii]|uniref:RNA polymerase sigma factor n=1 Tax=Parapedobacter defluvii TaxID=2045106 RepID=A0ABQ1LCB3_9SPHI|nr:RNA polymerase sigma-70 factor [Parapedobacter defluvii]GGC22491.1 DNA-directed RNA polymerase sigma-70 factor [Parapedobacter defluvii]
MNTDEDKNEKELLAQIQYGSQLAFRLLFERYHPFVYAFSRRITHSEELAEEIVQDVFLKIWLDRERLNTVDHFPAYLNRIVRNHCFNVLRKLASETKHMAEHLVGFEEADHSTVENLDYKDVKRILDEAVESLPAQQKRVYQLCHQEGLKYEEAAERLNLSPQTVHAYMKEALRKIRAHFKNYAVSYVAFFMALFS